MLLVQKLEDARRLAEEEEKRALQDKLRREEEQRRKFEEEKRQKEEERRKFEEEMRKQQDLDRQKEMHRQQEIQVRHGNWAAVLNLAWLTTRVYLILSD